MTHPTPTTPPLPPARPVTPAEAAYARACWLALARNANRDTAMMRLRWAWQRLEDGR